jgi:Limiting CO2-inducible proteins B/C beta carbonyic anhydrases
MKIGQAFPGALSNSELLNQVSDILGKKGFTKDTTLVASSLCSDEVNRPLEDTFLKYYGLTFST